MNTIYICPSNSDYGKYMSTEYDNTSIVQPE